MTWVSVSEETKKVKVGETLPGGYGGFIIDVYAEGNIEGLPIVRATEMNRELIREIVNALRESSTVVEVPKIIVVGEKEAPQKIEVPMEGKIWEEEEMIGEETEKEVEEARKVIIRKVTMPKISVKLILFPTPRLEIRQVRG